LGPARLHDEVDPAGPGVPGRIRSRFGRNGDERPAPPEDAPGAFQRVSADRIQHDVHVAEHLLESCRPVVDHRLDAQLAQELVMAWIGLMKFTMYEAEGIHPFVANSPLMSWLYGPMSVRGFSAMLGVVEVAIANLIAARPFSPRASALGAALAVGMFLTTLSFPVTTPGVLEPSAGGFPALSALPGQFLIKDLEPYSGFRSGRSARPGRRANKGHEDHGVSVPLYSHADNLAKSNWNAMAK
jgi:hypothetical protein